MPWLRREAPSCRPGSDSLSERAPSDEELFARYRERGDVSALGDLLERYRRPLYNFILRHLGDRSRAEEVLQETLLRAVHRADRFEGKSRFSTWLYTIARNLCIDTSRKLVFRRHRSLDEPLRGRDGGEAGATLGDRVTDGAPDVGRLAESARLRAAVVEAVEALPPEQREVFLMREVQGMPFKEIAQVVGVSENTVKSRMRYALERLRAALASYEEVARKPAV